MILFVGQVAHYAMGREAFSGAGLQRGVSAPWP